MREISAWSASVAVRTAVVRTPSDSPEPAAPRSVLV